MRRGPMADVDEVGMGRPAGKLDAMYAAQYRALTRYILERPTPCTIAVHGEWGIGKTRILQEIQENINSRSVRGQHGGVAGSYYFDAWKYASYTDSSELGLALAAQIDEHFGGMRRRLSRWRWRRSLRWLASSAAAGVDGYTTLAPGENLNPLIFTTRALLTAASGDREERDLTKALEAEAKVKKGLKAGVSRFISQHPGSDRIIVFVDNLDRIDPQKALRLLQTVCNLLDFEQIAVVVAVDLGVIREHLRGESRSGAPEAGVSAARERFLDKMIHLEYRVPSLGYTFSDVIRAQAQGYLDRHKGMFKDNGPDGQRDDTPQPGDGRRSVAQAPAGQPERSDVEVSQSSYEEALIACDKSVEILFGIPRNEKSEVSLVQKHLKALIRAVGGVNPRSMDKVLQAVVLIEMIRLEIERDDRCPEPSGPGIIEDGETEALDIAWLRLGGAILQVHLPLKYERLYKAVASESIREIKIDDQRDSTGDLLDPESMPGAEKESTDQALGALLDDDAITGAFEGLLTLYVASGDSVDALSEGLGQFATDVTEARVPQTPVTTPTETRTIGGESPARTADAENAPDPVLSAPGSWIEEVVQQMEENLSDQSALAPEFLRRCTTSEAMLSDPFLPQYGQHLNGKSVSLYRRPESEVVGRVARLRPKLGEISYTNSAATLRFGRAGKQRDEAWYGFRKAVEHEVVQACRDLARVFGTPEGVRTDELGNWAPLVFRTRPTGLPFAIDVDLTRPTGLPFAIDVDLSYRTRSDMEEMLLDRYAEVARVAFREAYAAWGDLEGGLLEQVG